MADALILAAIGYAGYRAAAGWWVLLAAAAMTAAVWWPRLVVFRRADAPPSSKKTTYLVMSIAINLAFAVVAYLAGHAVRRLLHG